MQAPKHAKKAKAAPIQRDWLAKNLAGIVLGLAMALAASAWLARLTNTLPLPTRAQLAMWCVPPVWMAVWSGVYFFRSGRRAWGWLGTACLICYGGLWLVGT